MKSLLSMITLALLTVLPVRGEGVDSLRAECSCEVG